MEVGSEGSENPSHEARDAFSRSSRVQQPNERHDDGRSRSPPSYVNLPPSAENAPPFGRDQTPEDLATIRVLAYAGSRLAEVRRRS